MFVVLRWLCCLSSRCCSDLVLRLRYAALSASLYTTQNGKITKININVHKMQSSFPRHISVSSALSARHPTSAYIARRRARGYCIARCACLSPNSVTPTLRQSHCHRMLSDHLTACPFATLLYRGYMYLVSWENNSTSMPTIITSNLRSSKPQHQLPSPIEN